MGETLLHNHASRRLFKLWIKVSGLHLPVRHGDDPRHKMAVRNAPAALPIGPHLPRRSDLERAIFLRFSLCLAPAAQRRNRPVLGHATMYAIRLPFDKSRYENYALGVSAEILHFQGMTDAPNRIRELRLVKGWSQQRLADKVGVTKMTISDLERGEMQLTQHYMRRLADALGCTAADLLPAIDHPYYLSPEERHLIDQMRAAGAKEREQLRKLADVVIPWRNNHPDSDAA